jgi:hypothetical protein
MPHFRRKVASDLRPSLRQAAHVAPTHHESGMKGGALPQATAASCLRWKAAVEFTAPS